MTEDVAELIAECWQDLLDKDDRTSPAEYPDHALITRDELADYIASALDRLSAQEWSEEDVRRAVWFARYNDGSDDPSPEDEQLEWDYFVNTIPDTDGESGRRFARDRDEIWRVAEVVFKRLSTLPRLSAQAEGGENLRARDDFIVSRGLWGEFVDSLPDKSDAPSRGSPQRPEPPQPLTKVVDMMAALRGAIVLEQWQEEVSDLVAEAYAAGCQAVHDHYTPDTHPDFSEAASDYAAYKADQIAADIRLVLGARQMTAADLAAAIEARLEALEAE